MTYQDCQTVEESPPYQSMVVDLAVVDEPDLGVGVEPHGLHAPHVVHDGQAVEAQAAAVEVVDVLDPEGVRASVLDGVHGVALHRHVVAAAEHGPDSAHGGGGDLQGQGGVFGWCRSKLYARASRWSLDVCTIRCCSVTERHTEISMTSVTDCT